MASPVTAPGWYRLGPKGLEYVAPPDVLPGDLDGVPHITELVKVELAGQMTEEPLW